ncbi:MAG: D-alanyl-D-alanine carboxypeptidase, partial [Longimicrobiales bacterium]|nr:D-alanyl-D-alanine carboxypeptidase [Longimicrobiales bacterium]
AGSRQMARRMGRTAAAENLRAKTGTMARVSSLSGVVRTADGERVAFSIVGNDLPSTAGAKRLEDRIGQTLAAWRR